MWSGADDRYDVPSPEPQTLMRHLIVPTLAMAALAACQTAPKPQSGFLSAYDGLTEQTGTIRASVRERRDDGAAAGIERLFIEPAVLHPGAAEGLDPADVALVLSEVDRQICFELSERFTVLGAADPAAARVRTAVTGVRATGQAGSAASAVAGYFIPGPIGLRAPGTTGGLAVESELVGPDGRQAAALVWARDANVVGTDSPSLSRVGDALQLAEPMGDAVGDAFAPKDRKPRRIAEPDPCRRFGARMQPVGFLAGMATGLYVPELSGTGVPKDADGAIGEELKGRTTMSTFPDGSVVYMAYGADGQFTGRMGDATWSGRYTVADGKLCLRTASESECWPYAERLVPGQEQVVTGPEGQRVVVKLLD